MKEKTVLTAKKRELWIDDVKVVACILVVFGHLMQSLVIEDILPASFGITWAIRLVYYFHVPLFFICSGYLYQRSRRIDSARAWGKNSLQKLLDLGVPYVFFSVAVWCVKTFLSGAGTSKVGDLADALLIHPISPYWYLYCLFLIFLITPTLNSRTHTVVVLVAALVMKALAVIGLGAGYHIIASVLNYEIWFVLGMLLCRAEVPQKVDKKGTFIVAGVAFLLLSVLDLKDHYGYLIDSFIMGLLACYAVVGLFIVKDRRGEHSAAMAWLAPYTMPIFLMHSIFVATLRSILLKLGIVSPGIHILAALAIGIIGPIITAIVMKKLKYPEFVMYPGKFIKIK